MKSLQRNKIFYLYYAVGALLHSGELCLSAVAKSFIDGIHTQNGNPDSEKGDGSGMDNGSAGIGFTVSNKNPSRLTELRVTLKLLPRMAQYKGTTRYGLKSR